ncbi:MAG: N-6 DNA methylase [Sandaracinus sp.]|nr:N-6 DNA methylase [Sandaracinus sp.]
MSPTTPPSNDAPHDLRAGASPFVLTTHPGLERLVCAELADQGWAGEPVGEGRVAVVAALPSLLTLRSVHHVLTPRGRTEVDSLDALTAWAGTLRIPELGPDVSFVVRCEREGEHAFTSPDVERAVGGALQITHRSPVNLRDPAVLVAVEVQGRDVLLDVQHTKTALSHRGYPRPYQQRTSLKADVAYACLRAAAEALGRNPDRVIDPFCGSGTLLLEAAELFPDARLFGSDKKPDAAEGAAANLRVFGHAARSQVVTAELDLARRRHGEALGAIGPSDVVVTNPPYGVRMGARLDFPSFYRRLFRTFEAPVHVVLATEEEALFGAAAEVGLQGHVAWRPRTGSIAPAIAVFART